MCWSPLGIHERNNKLNFLNYLKRKKMLLFSIKMMTKIFLLSNESREIIKENFMCLFSNSFDPVFVQTRSLKKERGLCRWMQSLFYTFLLISLWDIYYSMDSTCKHIWRNMCEIFLIFLLMPKCFGVKRKRSWVSEGNENIICCVSWVYSTHFICFK